MPFVAGNISSGWRKKTDGQDDMKEVGLGLWCKNTIKVTAAANTVTVNSDR